MTSDNLYRLLGSGPETNLAEEYARVVDHIGRLAGAVEDGNLYYAWEKAGELRSRLEAFERRLGEEVSEDGETYARFTGRDLDGQKVATAAVAFSISFGHRAGKLLHSADQIKDGSVRAQVMADDESNRRLRGRFGA